MASRLTVFVAGTQVHSIAMEAVRAAPMPMTQEAIASLRTALIPAMQAFVDAAAARAAARGANEVTDEDFEEVLSYYQSLKA